MKTINTGYLHLRLYLISPVPFVSMFTPVVVSWHSLYFSLKPDLATATNNSHILGYYEAVTPDKPPEVGRLSLWKHSFFFPTKSLSI